DAQGATRQLALRDAVMATADAAGANLRAVIDSNTAMTALANVDPADHAAVTAALQAAVQANPHLAAQSGPPRGGVDFSGHGAGEVTPAQFAAMSYAERVALHHSDPDTYRRHAGARPRPAPRRAPQCPADRAGESEQAPCLRPPAPP